MKIVLETNTKLILRNKSNTLLLKLGAIMGSIFFLTGLMVIILGKFSLSCNRVESNIGTCEFEKILLGKRRIPLNQLHGAKVINNDSDTGSHNDSNTNKEYQIDIITDKGQELLTFSSDLTIAFRINSFIGNPEQKNLVVKQDVIFDNNVSWIITIGCIITTSFIIALIGVSCIRTYTFDKALNSFILKRQSLYDTEVVQHQIQEIKDVELEYLDDCSRITLILVSDARVPFTSFYSDAPGKEKVVQHIRKFLNTNEL